MNLCEHDGNILLPSYSILASILLPSYSILASKPTKIGSSYFGTNRIETKKWKNTTFESGFLKKWVAKTPLLNVGFKSAKTRKTP